MPISPVRGVKRPTNVVSMPTRRRTRTAGRTMPPASGEQRAFGQQLADQPAAAGAERGAHRQLAIAAAAAAPASGWRRWRRRSAGPGRWSRAGSAASAARRCVSSSRTPTRRRREARCRGDRRVGSSAVKRRQMASTSAGRLLAARRPASAGRTRSAIENARRFCVDASSRPRRGTGTPSTGM